ncbi:hypothetical protein [Chlorobium sp. KB01]|uniref:hypothetical protein n=1 Tax=Chlorobium sp. KB01 TaxID=1917528 RepID=UPI0009788EB5|nr:hypothetical protein [Chlorobium sp. KB01]
MQRSDNKQRRIERHQGMGELKQAISPRSQDKLRWTKQARVQQTRMNRKGKEEDNRKNDEGEAGPDSPEFV